MVWGHSKAAAKRDRPSKTKRRGGLARAPAWFLGTYHIHLKRLSNQHSADRFHTPSTGKDHILCLSAVRRAQARPSSSPAAAAAAASFSVRGFGHRVTALRRGNPAASERVGEASFGAIIFGKGQRGALVRPAGRNRVGHSHRHSPQSLLFEGERRKEKSAPCCCRCDDRRVRTRTRRRVRQDQLRTSLWLIGGEMAALDCVVADCARRRVIAAMSVTASKGRCFHGSLARSINTSE